MTEKLTAHQPRDYQTVDRGVADQLPTRARAPNNMDDLTSCKFWLAVFAEFLGTAILVLVACGSCSQGKAANGPVQIGLTFGLSVATIVWIIGHISGGHINPAVTSGFLFTRKISIIRAVMYVVGQTTGGLVGAGVLKALSAPNLNDALCNAQPQNGTTLFQTFFVEFLICFVFVLTVFATCDSLRVGFNGSGPLAIGLAITMCHYWAMNYTGSAMNPARAFASSVASGYLPGHLAEQAMYWIGPLIGGAVGGLLYDLVLATNASCAKAKAFFCQRDYDDSQFDNPDNKGPPLITDGGPE